jgi:hypothetical protein
VVLSNVIFQNPMHQSLHAQESMSKSRPNPNYPSVRLLSTHIGNPGSDDYRRAERTVPHRVVPGNPEVVGAGQPVIVTIETDTRLF